jgi:hypothetical protein
VPWLAISDSARRGWLLLAHIARAFPLYRIRQAVRVWKIQLWRAERLSCNLQRQTFLNKAVKRKPRFIFQRVCFVHEDA